MSSLQPPSFCRAYRWSWILGILFVGIPGLFFAASLYEIHISSPTIKAHRRTRHATHHLRNIHNRLITPATQMIRKYGTPNTRIQEPSPHAMPSTPPSMPTIVPPPVLPPPTRSERFFRGVAKVMTSSWNGNIFVWLPAISTDPNTGPTYGLMPVLVLAEPIHHHIRHLLAPSYTYNSLFGQTGTARYYFYPTDKSQLYATGSISQHVNNELKARYENAAFLDGRAFIFAEGLHNADASLRFYGLGPATSAGNQTGYTGREASARAAMGVNFLKVWRFSVGLRYRRLDVDDTIIPGIANLRTTFPGLNGTSPQNTVAHEVRLLWDTRDEAVTPTCGSSGEFYVETTNETFGSDSDFTRFGLEGKRFFNWKDPNQTTIIHGLFDQVNGPNIPFYELSMLGGRETLRGFGEGRFTDKGRLLFNVEHRITFAKVALMGVETKFEVAPFIDVGEVFQSLGYAEARYVHPVFGGAFRAVVVPNVVGSVDVGVGNEGTAVFVGINYPF